MPACLFMTQTCPQCTQPFDCTGCMTGQCWCMQYPAIFACTTDGCKPGDHTQDQATPVAAASTPFCLCPDCLTRVTRAHISQHIDTVRVHEDAPVLTAQQRQKTFIEGLDYTLEAGSYVFSRWFLLKQGKCCGNGCRNCPFGHINVPF